MIDLFLVVYLAWRNSIRAKQKGQNNIVWVFITILSFYICELIGAAISMVFFYRGNRDLESMKAFVLNMPFTTFLFILFCGIGGYLIVRYILDSMPNKPGQDLTEEI